MRQAPMSRSDPPSENFLNFAFCILHFAFNTGKRLAEDVQASLANVNNEELWDEENHKCFFFI